MKKRKNTATKKLGIALGLCALVVLGSAVKPNAVEAKTLGKVQQVSVTEQKVEGVEGEKLTGLQIRWKAVPECTGYKVYAYGVVSKKWRCIKTTKNTEYVLTNLLEKAQVKIKVRAYQKGKGGRNTYGKYSKAVLCKAAKFVAPVDEKGLPTKAFFERYSSEQAFELQNKYRKKKHRSKIKWSNELYKLCEIRVKQLAKDFSHDKFISESKKFLKKKYGIKDQFVYVKKKGVTYGVLLMSGENIAFGKNNFTDAMKNWKGSPGHWKNIIRKECKSGAIACHVEKDNSVYWVAIFSDADFDKSVRKAKKK